MRIEYLDNDTIVAISTAPGVGGIAIIRVSGKEAFDITNQLFVSKKDNFNIAEQKAYTMHFGQFIDPANQQPIDEVIISIFKAPHSFTGDNVVEIACHGSLFLQQKILQILIQQGCRLATAGEFTQRAFTNGRIDLSQAEAVADLIQAQSSSAHTLALNQMRGGFSSYLAQLRMQLLEFAALLELELDFGDHEDLEFADRTQLCSLAYKTKGQIEKLQSTFATGNAIKNGIPIAIVGETNAGKSTLLNLLVGDNRAIVSNIHGTTRDVIEDTVNINGVMFRFIDTAGIRQTSDEIENLGIERTYNMIEKAQIVLWIVDSTAISDHTQWLAERIFQYAGEKKVIIVDNKIDRLNDEEIDSLREWFKRYDHEKIEISAKRETNTDHLRDVIFEAAQVPEISSSDLIVTNMRHYEALTKAKNAIELTIEGLENQTSADFVAQDVRECLFHLAEITGGEITSDEILSTIFSRFCIGK